MILGRPFLATIHAEIDVFNKEISLGIREDRVTFDMDKKIHNFMTPVGKEQSSKKARMLKPDTNTPSVHFCKPVKQNCNEILKVWPTCDPTKNDRKGIKGGGLSFLDFLLVRYGDAQGNDLIWGSSEPVKKALLKSWIIDCFREELVKDPRSKSFDDYKWMFNLEIDQLADEYELGIGKKGHMLDDIWENYNKVQGDNTY
ncbi:hypothetical protein Tco_0958860 [Tanacetum coccineum]